MSQIPFIDLKSQQKRISKELKNSIDEVLSSGQFIQGEIVGKLEEELSIFSGVKNVITCGNGTDALSVVLMAWGVGPGDAVFVPSFTYVATAETVSQLGATPFFVDVDASSFNICVESFRQGITEAKVLGLVPKVVTPVDLFGLPSDVKAIEKIAAEEGIKVLVDSAQAFGAKIERQRAGNFGSATATSFFPAKPLGCYGDGGAVLTNDDELAATVRSICLHGRGEHKYQHARVGVNSRLDTLQAAVLREKLKIYDSEIEARNRFANYYNENIGSPYKLPSVPKNRTSVWAQYTILAPNRDELQQSLRKNGIPSVIYYPISLHRQEAYRYCPSVKGGLPVSEGLEKKVLSLPMHPYLSTETQELVVDAINSFV